MSHIPTSGTTSLTWKKTVSGQYLGVKPGMWTPTYRHPDTPTTSRDVGQARPLSRIGDSPVKAELSSMCGRGRVSARERQPVAGGTTPSSSTRRASRSFCARRVPRAARKRLYEPSGRGTDNPLRRPGLLAADAYQQSAPVKCAAYYQDSNRPRFTDAFNEACRALARTVIGAPHALRRPRAPIDTPRRRPRGIRRPAGPHPPGEKVTTRILCHGHLSRETGWVPGVGAW